MRYDITWALDVGAEENGKLKAWGPDGLIPLPVTPRGLTPAEKFIHILREFSLTGHGVFESPTVGMSGVEPDEVAKVVAESPYDLFTISARRVKNYLKDHPDIEKTDENCARIIYEIASAPNAELKKWTYAPAQVCFECGRRKDSAGRRYHSVRPYDKRLYRGAEVDSFMAELPPFSSLPEHVQALLTNGRKRNPDYRRAAVLPLAMAMREELSITRDGYEKIIGLSESGYPSFYRRCTVAFMQMVAKKTFGVKKFAEITPAQRKEAWKETRRIIRLLYSLARQNKNYAPGTCNPLARSIPCAALFSRKAQKILSRAHKNLPFDNPLARCIPGTDNPLAKHIPGTENPLIIREGNVTSSRVTRARQTEAYVAEYLREHGFPGAERIPASLPGSDIQGIEGVSIEVKARRGLNLIAWLKQAAKRDGLPVLIVRGDGQGQAMLTEWAFVVPLRVGVELLNAWRACGRTAESDRSPGRSGIGTEGDQLELPGA